MLMILQTKELFGLAIYAWLLLGHAIAGLGNPQPRDYSVIFERNPFGLRPPPPPRTNTTAVAPKPEIFLTGITSFGNERAYFMSSPVARGNPEYFSLSIGEGKDRIEVLDIDPAAKTVRVRMDGIETVMTFEANGVKAPPVVRATTGKGASPPLRPSVVGTTKPGSRVRTIPTRQVRTVPPPKTSSYSSQAASRPFAAEQDALLMELQRTANPHMTFPPTPMPRFQ